MNPQYYTVVEGGHWLDNTYKNWLIPEIELAERRSSTNVTFGIGQNARTVHALLFEVDSSTRDSQEDVLYRAPDGRLYARWDCVNGWTHPDAK